MKMKKKMSLLAMCLCLVCIALPAQAQLRFGLKGGLNVSKVSFSGDVFDGENRSGFFIGPMAEFTFPILGIGVDVAALYNKVDARAVNRSTQSVIDDSFKSMEIPVNVKWSFGSSRLGVYVAAGPQFGFNVGSGQFANQFKAKKHYTTFNVGAGVKLFRHFQVGANYNFGINKMAKCEEDGTTISVKKNTWQVSLAYLF